MHAYMALLKECLTILIVLCRLYPYSMVAMIFNGILVWSSFGANN